MSAIGLQSPAARPPAGAGVLARPAWPWLTTALLTVAFLLAVHDPLASQSWQKTVKGDIVNLSAKEANGRLTRQLGFLLLGAVGAGLLIAPGNRPLRPVPALAFALAMLLLWTLLSAAWSADAAITLKRQFILLCTLVAALGLIRRFDVDRLAQIAFVHTLLILLIGIGVEAALFHKGSFDEEYRFAGTLHPNHAGINATLLLMCSLFLWRRRADRRLLLVAAVAAAALLLTKSRTALAAAVAGTAAFVALAWPARHKLALLVGLAVGIGGVVALIAADLAPGMTETVLLNRKSSDPATLTGRTMIWEFALGHLGDDYGRIFAGFGYGGFWTEGMTAALSQRAHFTLSEGHNAYLDILLQLGVVGLFFYLCCVAGALAVWLAAARRSHSVAAAFAVALLAYTLVHHFAESAMTAPGFPTLILWTVIGSAALRRASDRSPGGTP